MSGQELARLTYDLRRASSEAQRKAWQAVRKAAYDVQAKAKRRAPVDTGTLQSSITVSPAGAMAVEVGPHAHYGSYVELGTRRMAARPYLMPSFDEVVPELDKALEEIGVAW